MEVGKCLHVLIATFFLSGLLPTSAVVEDGWSWQLASAPDELVPDSIVNFTLTAPPSELTITINSSVTHNVLVTWNETFSWWIPAPASTSNVIVTAAVPFLDPLFLNVSILDLTNATVYSVAPQFSQLATSYQILVTPQDDKDLVFVDSTPVTIQCEWRDENGTLLSAVVWATHISEDLFSCAFSYTTDDTYTAGLPTNMSVLRTFSDSNSSAIDGQAIIPTAAVWTGVLAAVPDYICGNHSSVTIVGAFYPNRTYACIFHGKEPHLSNFTAPAADGFSLTQEILLPKRGYDLEIIHLFLTAVYEKKTPDENATLVYAYVSNVTDTSVGFWECVRPWYLKYLPVLIAVPAGVLTLILLAVLVRIVCLGGPRNLEEDETAPLRINRA